MFVIDSNKEILLKFIKKISDIYLKKKVIIHYIYKRKKVSSS